MTMNRFLFVSLSTAAFAFSEEYAYQKPPKAVLDMLNAPLPWTLTANPSKTHVMLTRLSTYPSIADLAQPMYRLAGVRINPLTNGPHANRGVEAMRIKRLSDGAEVSVALPAGAKVDVPRWSPDGTRFAFLSTQQNGIELWIGDTATGKTRRVDGAAISDVVGLPVNWFGDGKTLLAQLVPAGRGAAPQKPVTPKGPKVQESSGRAAGIWTNPDALTSPHDEDLFEYYATAQLALVDAATGKVTPYGKPGIFMEADPSPDGNFVLVSRIHRPFSFLHFYSQFPKDVEIWDRSANRKRTIANLALEDRVPVDGVPTGPRGVNWQANEPATVLWAEAMDGGNPKEKVPHRDRLLQLVAPFSGDAKEVYKTEHRYRGTSFTEDGRALVADFERNRRWIRVMAVDLNNPAAQPKVVMSRDMRDRYRDPGQPVTTLNQFGQPVARSKGGVMLFSGLGATPKGDRPFLNRKRDGVDEPETLFRSGEDAYEAVSVVLDGEGKRFITRRESPTEPPNYFLHENGKVTPLTDYKDPTPQLRAIKKELVTYKRPDGVQLSFTLYLPPGYQPGTRLPTVVWAYPLEYNDADTAGQVSGSTQRFTTLSGTSHLFYLLNGYAVLDNATMPVVGSIEQVNDTYIEQIVASAKAAIDKATEMGVTDPARVGVGGHSYGAFMTANLLAHSDLFRAGVARSGAYNRTLTPFGFQSERRTLWEAPQTYLKMSPFLHANKINEPILLIHGEADNNQGTFPIQSERMYQAIRGNGGTVRYVVLPHESHGYAARESVEHTVWEMLNWFDRHVKNATPSLPSN